MIPDDHDTPLIVDGHARGVVVPAEIDVRHAGLVERPIFHVPVPKGVIERSVGIEPGDGEVIVAIELGGAGDDDFPIRLNGDGGGSRAYAKIDIDQPVLVEGLVEGAVGVQTQHVKCAEIDCRCR